MYSCISYTSYSCLFCHVRSRWQFAHTISHFLISLDIANIPLPVELPILNNFLPRTWSKSMTCGGYLHPQSVQGAFLHSFMNPLLRSRCFFAYCLAFSGLSRRHAFFLSTRSTNPLRYAAVSGACNLVLHFGPPLSCSVVGSTYFGSITYLRYLGLIMLPHRIALCQVLFRISIAFAHASAHSHARCSYVLRTANSRPRPISPSR